MLCFVPVLHGCLVCLLLCKEEGSSPVSAFSERRDMDLYEVPLVLVLLFVFQSGSSQSSIPAEFPDGIHWSVP